MKNIIKKKKNVYFSNMKQIIKHYPMTDRLIVIREYMLFQLRKFFFSDATTIVLFYFYKRST
jgi:hypothetical protein